MSTTDPGPVPEGAAERPSSSPHHRSIYRDAMARTRAERIYLECYGQSDALNDQIYIWTRVLELLVVMAEDSRDRERVLEG